MITKQVIQTCIDDLNELTGEDFFVIDNKGIVMASTFEYADTELNMAKGFFDSPADSQIIGENYLFKIKEDDEACFVLLSRGNRPDSYLTGKIAANEISHLCVAYREQFDHNGFVQNLLLDNLLLVDIYNKSKKLGIVTKADRVVFAVEMSIERQREALLVLKSAFSQKMDDFVTSVDEKSVILVHTLEPDETYADMDNIAEMLQEVMNTEAMIDARVSYGNIVEDIKDISKSYKEAKMAMDVGKIFYQSRKVLPYDSLGIGRLIYQIPVSLCKLYVQEIFGDNVPSEIDDEIINTAVAFLENNLNASETSRQLYIHRNTLVYRIEKLKESTGLDVRSFDDALTFKIALMVVNYIKFMDSME